MYTESLHVVVLMGGPSSESEVSRVSGKAVVDTLLSRGYEVTGLEFDDATYDRLREINPDVVFIALHGSPGEDGTVQGMLEILGIPYTGSGVLASALAINKAKCREFLSGHNVRMPKGRVISNPDELFGALDELKSEGVVLPVIVKPSSAGSSVGLSRVHDENLLPDAVHEAFKFSKEVIIEECLPGPEITISIIGNGQPIILPSIEIISEKGIYDYEAKYTPGMSHHIIPPDIDPEAVREAEEMAFRIYKLLGLNGFGRGEVMFDKELKPHFLEFNTIPGLTAVSLLPDAARAAGIEFGELCERLLQYALVRQEQVG